MILRHNKTGKIYKLVGIEINGFEITLKLQYYYQTDKGQIKKVGRSTSVYGWSQLIEQMEKFDEISSGNITEQNAKEWLNI